MNINIYFSPINYHMTTIPKCVYGGLHPPPSPTITLPHLCSAGLINAHLKNHLKCPGNCQCPPAINKVSYMKVSRLPMLIQDGQLQSAVCLKWQHILKWYFSKYYQVCGRRVFTEPVTYNLLSHASKVACYNCSCCHFNCYQWVMWFS